MVPLIRSYGLVLQEEMEYRLATRIPACAGASTMCL
jgi:hypothetical protein